VVRELKRVLVTGNEAVVEGAIAAGCNFYVGYPITPSSEIMHYMAEKLPRIDGVFFQAEDELAAINIAIGASWGGARVMTATSGPGFSLMQEGIGYAVMTETPLVIVNVMRAGPATGQATKLAQGDLMQSRWGRHGDQVIPVLAPESPQEAFELTVKAFAIAEELRVPVILLSDETIAHMREVIELPNYESIKIPDRRKPTSIGESPFGSKDPRIAPPMPSLGEGYYVLVTGSTHNEWGYRDTRSFETHYKLSKRLWDKVWLNIDKIAEYEAYHVVDADVGFVAFGSTARSVKMAVKILREKGVKAGFVRLKTLWPLDLKPIRNLCSVCKVVVVPELNLGQLVLDVERANEGNARVISYGKVGGGEFIYPKELVRIALEGLKS